MAINHKHDMYWSGETKSDSTGLWHKYVCTNCTHYEWRLVS